MYQRKVTSAVNVFRREFWWEFSQTCKICIVIVLGKGFGLVSSDDKVRMLCSYSFTKGRVSDPKHTDSLVSPRDVNGPHTAMVWIIPFTHLHFVKSKEKKNP